MEVCSIVEKDTHTKSIAGFTLIELIVVIAILGILAVIAVPKVSAFIDQAEKVTCETNRNQLEKPYNAYMEMEDIAHTPSLFTNFKDEFFGDQAICPEDGIIDWNNGKVTCSIHIEDTSSGGNEDEDDSGGEVPYL